MLLMMLSILMNFPNYSWASWQSDTSTIRAVVLGCFMLYLRYWLVYLCILVFLQTTANIR